ncbi:MAG: hypothetical protein AVDCRST_MAG29-346, partial [uncultured Nocardioidaceae bacterium]
ARVEQVEALRRRADGGRSGAGDQRLHRTWRRSRCHRGADRGRARRPAAVRGGVLVPDQADGPLPPGQSVCRGGRQAM